MSGYEPIPDVEAAIEQAATAVEASVTPEEAAPTMRSRLERGREKYPDVSEAEAEFLVTLDDGFESVAPTMTVERVRAEDIGQPDVPVDYLDSLKIPTLVLVAAIAFAFLVIFIDNGIVEAIYPYFGCIVMLIATIPATRKRVLTKLNPALEKMYGTQQTVDTLVAGCASTAMTYLKDAEKAMPLAIGPINKTLSLAKRSEKSIPKIDPRIDPTEIEDAFYGLEDKLKGAYDKVVVDVRGQIPPFLRNLRRLEYYGIYPYLAIFLVLQVLGVFATQEGGVSTSHVWFLIWFAIQAYITAIVQMALLFFLTSVKFVTARTNGFLASVEREANTKLEDSTSDTYKFIFRQEFNKTKDKMLDLMKRMKDLAGPDGLRNLAASDQSGKDQPSRLGSKRGFGFGSFRL